MKVKNGGCNVFSACCLSFCLCPSASRHTVITSPTDSFWAAIHILSVNCAKTIEDRPGQPAYEMFGIKRRFQRCKVWPLGSRRPPYERMKFGYPLENVRFLLLVREWLQIDTDLLRIITSPADELSRGTNIDDLERPWTPKIGVLVNFSLF